MIPMKSLALLALAFVVQLIKVVFKENVVHSLWLFNVEALGLFEHI